MIISGFAGIGKTYLGNKYEDIIDLESSDYKWIYSDEVNGMDWEKRKGLTERLFNPDWPENYINAILEAEKKYKIVLISQSVEILAELRLRKIPFIVVIPDINLKEEYIARCRKRGNNEVFIGFISDYYEYFINKLMSKDDPKVILKSGEYLEDVLIKEGYYKEREDGL